jgi:hypothetical protein
MPAPSAGVAVGGSTLKLKLGSTWYECILGSDTQMHTPDVPLSPDICVETWIDSADDGHYITGRFVLCRVRLRHNIYVPSLEGVSKEIVG